MKILYSFNKRGYEARFWTREIAAASSENLTFIPFNHDPYLDTSLYLRAQELDHRYFDRHPGLMRLYSDVERRVRDESIDVLFVDNCPPYHPDWLATLPVYKVLRTSDGPVTAYDRDIPYVHAYDHVFFHSPAYSRDMDMEQKLRYVGAKRADFLPLGLFDAAFDPAASEQEVMAGTRDVDVVFIGAQYINKMPLFAKVKKALGRRCRLHGLSNLKRNLYFNLKFGSPGWVSAVAFEQYMPLYRRAKIGFNVHNRGKYTVGSFRLFELPANGVMQISDGGEYLDRFFKTGEEIVNYETTDELVDKILYYLDREEERVRIARNGYRRVIGEYRFRDVVQRAGELITTGLKST